MPWKGYAPGWELRCPKCGARRPAADAGMVRVGAWSRGKRVLVRCRTGCGGRFRFAYLERTG